MTARPASGGVSSSSSALSSACPTAAINFARMGLSSKIKDDNGATLLRSQTPSSSVRPANITASANEDMALRMQCAERRRAAELEARRRRERRHSSVGVLRGGTTRGAAAAASRHGRKTFSGGGDGEEETTDSDDDENEEQLAKYTNAFRASSSHLTTRIRDMLKHVNDPSFPLAHESDPSDRVASASERRREQRRLSTSMRELAPDAAAAAAASATSPTLAQGVPRHAKQTRPSSRVGEQRPVSSLSNASCYADISSEFQHAFRPVSVELPPLDGSMAGATKAFEGVLRAINVQSTVQRRERKQYVPALLAVLRQDKGLRANFGEHAAASALEREAARLRKTQASRQQQWAGALEEQQKQQHEDEEKEGGAAPKAQEALKQKGGVQKCRREEEKNRRARVYELHRELLAQSYMQQEERLDVVRGREFSRDRRWTTILFALRSVAVFGSALHLKAQQQQQQQQQHSAAEHHHLGLGADAGGYVRRIGPSEVTPQLAQLAQTVAEVGFGYYARRKAKQIRAKAVAVLRPALTMYANKLAAVAAVRRHLRKCCVARDAIAAYLFRKRERRQTFYRQMEAYQAERMLYTKSFCADAERELRKKRALAARSVIGSGHGAAPATSPLKHSAAGSPSKGGAVQQRRTPQVLRNSNSPSRNSPSHNSSSSPSVHQHGRRDESPERSVSPTTANSQQPRQRETWLKELAVSRAVIARCPVAAVSAPAAIGSTATGGSPSKAAAAQQQHQQHHAVASKYGLDPQSARAVALETLKVANFDKITSKMSPKALELIRKYVARTERQLERNAIRRYLVELGDATLRYESLIQLHKVKRKHHGSSGQPTVEDTDMNIAPDGSGPDVAPEQVRNFKWPEQPHRIRALQPNEARVLVLAGYMLTYQEKRLLFEQQTRNATSQLLMLESSTPAAAAAAAAGATASAPGSSTSANSGGAATTAQNITKMVFSAQNLINTLRKCEETLTGSRITDVRSWVYAGM